MKDSEFKVGDIVYCALHGEGTVIEVTDYKKRSVGVKFKTGATYLYRADGKYREAFPRTLFFSPTWIYEGSRIRPVAPSLIAKNVFILTKSFKATTGYVLDEDESNLYLENHSTLKESIVKKSDILEIRELGSKLDI